MAKRRFKRRNKKPARKTIRRIAQQVAVDQQEHKLWAGQITAIAGGAAINTTGLKYLINCLPYANSTVTAGVIDSNPGLRGTGSQQVLGKKYKIHSFDCTLQIRAGADAPSMVRVICFREVNPEGTVFSTGPNSLLFDQGAGIGVISPVMKSNLWDGTTGRFVIYKDMKFELINQIAGSNDTRIIKLRKKFKNGPVCQTYDTLTNYAQNDSNTVGNQLNTAIWVVVLSNLATPVVERVYSSIYFTDA